MKKQNYIETTFSKIFPFIKLPKVLIKRLLLNKDERIDINSYY